MKTLYCNRLAYRTRPCTDFGKASIRMQLRCLIYSYFNKQLYKGPIGP